MAAAGKAGRPGADNVHENDGLNGNRLSALGNVCTHIVLPRQTKEVAHNTRPHLFPCSQCPFSRLSDSLQTSRNFHLHPDDVLTCYFHFGVVYHSTPNHCYSTPNSTNHYYTNSRSQLLLNSKSCWIPTWLRPWSYLHINIWRQYSYCQERKNFTVKSNYWQKQTFYCTASNQMLRKRQFNLVRWK